MAEEIRYLEKEIYKLRQHLHRLERRVLETHARFMGRNEEKRLERLKQELRKEYPDIEFTPKTIRLLKLVGTLPYSPAKRDREVIAEAISREYM